MMDIKIDFSRKEWEVEQAKEMRRSTPWPLFTKAGVGPEGFGNKM